MTTPYERWLIDTNVWVFGLRRNTEFPACAKLLDRIGFSSKGQKLHLDRVSTTCGSGWVNQPNSKFLVTSHADHYPPATAGGTDPVQVQFLTL